MGRPQRPIPDDDVSPEAEFARELRRLREAAGNPTLGVLARRTGYSDTTLSSAMGGRCRPSLDVTLALVTALGGDGAAWESRWRALPGAAGTPAPVPAGAPAEAEEDGAPAAVLVTPPAPAPPADVPPAPPRRSRRALLLAAVAAVVLAAVVAVVLGQRAADEESVTVTVQNLVTAGALGSREDTPAYLSTVPQNACRPRGCAVPGTDMNTGDRLAVVCQTTGERTTNGNDGDPADDTNPLLADSRLWYGVRLDDGSIGYLSEIWLSPIDRGGLGLPRCP